MPSFMRCCIKQPQECGEWIAYDGKVYGWMQVDVPRFGLLCFCPKHDEQAKQALEISYEHARRIQQRNDRLDEFFGRYGIRLPGEAPDRRRQ
jgi:hypothetical protein